MELKVKNQKLKGLTARERGGVTLLFVVLVVAATLSIAVGIFNAVFVEFRLAGEISQSFTALYAADQGIEQLLYQDRVLNSLCPGMGSCSYGPTTITLPNGACVTLRLNRVGKDTTAVSTGQFRCGTGELAVRRALQVRYQK